MSDGCLMTKLSENQFSHFFLITYDYKNITVNCTFNGIKMPEKELKRYEKMSIDSEPLWSTLLITFLEIKMRGASSIIQNFGGKY